ncbi:class I SAM-dependent methyltransferase [Morganella psychrotolerans]|uniref:Methyltransferase n=1 Tax=Morganella psychrotolerans TaxID=368603 RepID=A0A1B8HEV9_9GAMM|nr:rRNA adenine N-6-methyltransferase family protein [Morganella psychrotolerans]OBU07587.1 methyltransferase [Morganella psychrotolerans]
MEVSDYSPLRSYYAYIRKFIVSPATMGTIAPSSRWLCRAMVRHVNWAETQNFAELGAGTGVITRQILEQMNPQANLDAYEIDPYFVSLLNKFQDDRLGIFSDSAEKLNRPYNVIFSGLPFLSIDRRTGLRILKAVRDNIEVSDGQFILFQYTTKFEKYLHRYFHFRKERVLFNVPPAWVYICTPKKRQINH